MSKPNSSSSMPGTTPPTLASMSGTMSSESRRSPERPSIRRRQVASTPLASGETMPMPVITILSPTLPAFGLADMFHLDLNFDHHISPFYMTIKI